jgi:hypothetical protein
MTFCTRNDHIIVSYVQAMEGMAKRLAAYNPARFVYHETVIKYSIAVSISAPVLQITDDILPYVTPPIAQVVYFDSVGANLRMGPTRSR